MLLRIVSICARIALSKCSFFVSGPPVPVPKRKSFVSLVRDSASCRNVIFKRGDAMPEGEEFSNEEA
jgi:hypothetical protein